MKRLWPIVLLCLASVPLTGATDPWLYGRIVEVERSTTANTKAWVVNTPITEDVTTFTVSVHVGDRVLVGNYELTPEVGAPPEEWTENYPVKVQLTGNSMVVRGPTGEVRAHIQRRKNSKPMLPLTADEKKQLEQVEEPSAQSLTGFAGESKADAGKPAAEAEPQPAPAPLNAGTVTVRSTPYLSEVFVDGDSMGYTPAKINLPPGKHTFRVEKPGYQAWSKEMTITVGSELTLDATLARSQK